MSIKLELPEESQKVTQEPAAAKTPSVIKQDWNIVPLVTSFVFGVLLTAIFLRDVEPRDQKESDDQKQIIDDSKPSPPNAGLKDCFLIVVRDAKSTNESPEYTSTLQNDTFWRVTAPSIVKDVEWLEDDDDQGKKAISIAGIPAPLVLLYNTSTKKKVWSIPLPKGSVAEIERKLK